MSVPTQLVLSVHLFTCLTCVIRKKENISVWMVSLQCIMQLRKKIYVFKSRYLNPRFLLYVHFFNLWLCPIVYVYLITLFSGDGSIDSKIFSAYFLISSATAIPNLQTEMVAISSLITRRALPKQVVRRHFVTHHPIVAGYASGPISIFVEGAPSHSLFASMRRVWTTNNFY